MDDLAACLRSWRDRLTPAEAGLPGGGVRRAPGLRREEVAMAAGLSVDYLTRLEQGRATRPSVSVLEPLARALRLADAEREHLFRLAGHGGPAGGRVRRHVTPSLQRMLDRLTDVPVHVIDATYLLLDGNPLADALFGDYDDEGPRGRNMLWRHFTGLPVRVRHTPEQEDAFRDAAVADLHQTAGRHPDDPQVAALIADLRAASPDFAARWDRRPVGEHVSSRKTVAHPEVGDVVVDCDMLAVAGTDVRLLVYSAAPGSDAASKLALLGAIGRQRFAAG